MQGEAPKRAITGAEFFHRFPLLHSYLLDQLAAAATAMRAPNAQLHPSLYPILVLLARLRPSLHSRNAAQVRCQALRPEFPLWMLMTVAVLCMHGCTATSLKWNTDLLICKLITPFFGSAAPLLKRRFFLGKTLVLPGAPLLCD
jgi:hypothetical protein